MQSVGDQVTQLVANLEHDHIVALQRVDELAAANASISAENDAVKSASLVLEKQLADRTSALADTEKRMDEALAQVEVVANAALNMLKTVRGQRASLEAVQGSAVATQTPKPIDPAFVTNATRLGLGAVPIKQFTAKDVKMLDLAPLQDCVAFMKGDISGPAQKAGIIKEAEAALGDATQQDTAAIVDDTAHIDWDVLAEERLGQRPPAPYDVQVVGDIMAADDKVESDSGDEMVDLSPIKRAIEEKLAPKRTAGCHHVDCEFPNCSCDPDDPRLGPLVAPPQTAPPLAPAIAPPVELDAVDRMRRSADFLPAPSLSGSSGPVLVVRNEPLPIFLARDTVFGRNDPRL